MSDEVLRFGDGVRRGLGIRVRCGCGKVATFRASDFEGRIRPADTIAERVWRCSWCGACANDVRFTTLDRNDREGLAQWRPAGGSG